MARTPARSSNRNPPASSGSNPPTSSGSNPPTSSGSNPPTSSGSNPPTSSRNPLAIDPHREQRVRERAYHLWEADGKPHGRDVEYWERARELVGVEESAGSGRRPNPQTSPNSPSETGIEEAEIQRNLGEFPDRLADQGEVKSTPAPKRRARTKSKSDGSIKHGPVT